jgi:hypothetical protein
MRALFIELHVLHRSYKSQEKLRVKEQKKKEAASSTNIEDDINGNRNNEISTKIDAVANTDERKWKSADNTNNRDHNNDNKNNQISTTVVSDADAVAGPNTDDKDVTIDTAIHENNRTIIIQTAYSIAYNGAGADVGESIKDVENQFNEEEIE